MLNFYIHFISIHHQGHNPYFIIPKRKLKMKEEKNHPELNYVQTELTVCKTNDKLLADKDIIFTKKDCSRFVEAFSDCV